jgi:DNA repair protein RadC
MTCPSRRAELRLHIIHEENLPGSFHDVPNFFMKWGLHQEPQECVWVVAYDGNMTIRNVVEISRGSHVRADVHLPTLLAAVYSTGCERFMLVHNHPSNNPKPSMGDRTLTKEVMEAANTCGLYFEDHIILTPQGKWFSFVQQKLLKTVDYIEHSGASRS